MENDRTGPITNIFEQFVPNEYADLPKSTDALRRHMESRVPLKQTTRDTITKNVLPLAATAALMSAYAAFAPVVTTTGLITFGVTGFAAGKTYAALNSLSKKKGIIGAFARAAGGTFGRRLITSLACGSLMFVAAGAGAVKVDGRFAAIKNAGNALTDTVVGRLATGAMPLGGKVHLFDKKDGHPIECTNLGVNNISGGMMEFTCTTQFRNGENTRIHSGAFKTSELNVRKSVVIPNDKDAFLTKAFQTRNPATVALGEKIRKSEPVSPNVWFHNLYTDIKTAAKQVFTVLGLRSSAKPLAPT